MSQHPVKKGRRDIPTVLMAYSHQEDGSIRENFLPCLMLSRPKQEKSSVMQNLSEISIGKWHPSGKEGLHFFLRCQFMNGSYERSMGRSIGTLSESVILFHVLFCIIHGHLDQILERGLGGIPLRGQIKFWTGNDIFSLRGFNNGC